MFPDSIKPPAKAASVPEICGRIWPSSIAPEHTAIACTNVERSSLRTLIEIDVSVAALFPSLIPQTSEIFQRPSGIPIALYSPATEPEGAESSTCTFDANIG